jgi:hypothetical protein
VDDYPRLTDINIVDNYPHEANRRVEALISSMRTLIARDPEQEIQGPAIENVAAPIAAVKAAKPDDPVVAATPDLISADFIGSGEGIRAADVLVIAEQLNAALGPSPSVRPLGGFA